MQKRIITVTVGCAMLSLSACGTPQSESEEASPPAAETTPDTTSTPQENQPSQVVVKTASGEATYVIKDSDENIAEQGQFQGDKTIDLETSVYSVYVSPSEENVEVSCTVSVEDEEIASNTSSDDAARCWPGPR